jgi:lipid A 3-O-deacylase
MSLPRRFSVAIAVGYAVVLAVSTQAADASDVPDAPTNSVPNLVLESKLQPTSIWEDDSLGAGFHSGLHEVGAGIGGGFGMTVFGSSYARDILLSQLKYGWMLGGPVAKDHWYRGNWELVQELFGGVQLHPDSRYLFGETTVLRYNFATGTRWIPFVDAGMGLAATDIGRPDLGSTFEFNLQVGPGIRWFWSKNKALTCEYRLVHVSNAAIRDPDHGINGSVFYLGVTWLF